MYDSMLFPFGFQSPADLTGICRGCSTPLGLMHGLVWKISVFEDLLSCLSPRHGCLLLKLSVQCLSILRGSWCFVCSIFDPGLDFSGHHTIKMQRRGVLLSDWPRLPNMSQSDKLLIFLPWDKVSNHLLQ